MAPRTFPDLAFETATRAQGFSAICGVDEVGRGLFVGPVTAAAVILDPARIPDGLNDSKALTEARRAALFPAIMAMAQVSIAHASVAEIDELNILRASHLAMERAVNGLSTPPDHALIDGNLIPKGLTIPATAIVKGDARSLSIAARSRFPSSARTSEAEETSSRSRIVLYDAEISLFTGAIVP